MNSRRDWSDYFRVTRDGEVSPLVLDALSYVNSEADKALDLGAGALRNSKYLASLRYSVDAVDSAPGLIDESHLADNEKINPIVSEFDKFQFPERHYDLIVAISALLFNPPDTFEAVIKSILSSLKIGGVFCANFSGVEDEWAGDPAMTFVQENELRQLLRDVEIIKFTESKRYTAKALGGKKWSHQFEVIAKRVD